MALSFRRWLPFSLTARRRDWAVLAIVVVMLLAAAAWWGVPAWLCARDRAAARADLARYDFLAARRRLEACLARRPRDPQALLLAAQAARRDAHLDDARAFLDRHTDLVREPGPDAGLEYALLQVQRGRINDYLPTLREHLQGDHPLSEQILEALAQGSIQVYRLNAAEAWTRQLLERFPANPLGRLFDAQRHETHRRHDEALETARLLAQDHPAFDRGRLYYATLLLGDHRYGEAVDHFRAVVDRRPDNLPALVGLVRCLFGLGRPDESRDYVRRLQQRHPTEPDTIVETARLTLEDNQPAEAERLLRRTLKLYPLDREAHYLLDLCLDRQGKREEARRHAEQLKQIETDSRRLDALTAAANTAPRDPRPRLEAAHICFRNAQTEEGLRWLYGALEIDPRNPEAHAALADYFAARGNAPMAEHHREQASAGGARQPPEPPGTSTR